MKKPKKPGDNISLKTKKNESPLIIEWINSQTNLMDSIRYLIENEVMLNGVRNLQAHIPAERAISVALPISNKSNEGMANHHREIAATSEKQAAVEVKSTVPDVPLLGKETNKPLMDDDIDEEDIDSWI